MFNHCPPKQIPTLTSNTNPDGKRYYLTPNGKKLPSVTTVIGYSKRKIMQDWRDRVGHIEADRISTYSANRGKLLHSLCEDYVSNKQTFKKSNYTPLSIDMFKSIKPSLDKISDIEYIEQSFWSYTLGMAGKCDIIGKYDNVLSVIDFKSSGKSKPKEWIDNYFCQCVAYGLMYEEIVEIPIKQIVIIMAVENSRPQIFVEKLEDWTDTLIKYITEYRKSL